MKQVALPVPIAITVSRRVEKPGLCEVGDCVGWPWLQVQTYYTSVIGAQHTNLCDTHGRAFLMGLGQIWADEVPVPQQQAAKA